MENKFYFKHTGTMRIFKIVSLFFVLVLNESFAQKWSGVNGNEWLAGKYGQQWVRIGVTAAGIHKVDVNNLPQAFKDADKNRLELYHRGKQVSIIKADASEILFYGIPNDGSSDQLLYRLPTSRKNPHYSHYSDESAYFLTINPTINGNRAVTPVVVNNPSAVQALFHIKTDLKKYVNEYSHSTVYFYKPATLNSYLEEGKQGTGTSLYGQFLNGNIQTSNPKSQLDPGDPYQPVPFSFQVKVPYGSAPKKVNVHIKARLGASTAEIYVGKDATNLRSVGTLPVTNFNDYDYAFDLQNDDFDGNGGTLGFKSTKTGADGSAFCVSYFTVEYEQNTDMQNLNTYLFSFPAVSSGTQSKIAISNAPADVKVYDVSDPDVPRIISSTPGDFAVDRNSEKLTLLATKETISINPVKIESINFQDISPASYDYLIVCSGSLNSSSNTYANYRQLTSPGKKYKPIVKNIKDIYNQFNYGEPSPVAIRRFVDFMISDNNKDKYLLLIGKSVTYFERAVRELPDEVPTIGFPGSDLLLVDGLRGTQDDVPAIPVGRIAAISDQQVLDYLAKIIKYESQTDVSWRKNVLHMNGGKSPAEVSEFAGYLSAISGTVTNSPFSGKVVPKIKTIAADVTEEVSLSPELNGTAQGISGLGMISYFGHGSLNETDYNAGHVMNPAKGYNNPNNFPVLFYNGCGVNNVFSGRQALFGAPSLVRPMSLDWLLAPGKGAIIVMGNSWDAYASNSNEYLDRLYPLLFSVPDIQRKPIGNILQDVAQQMKTAKGYSYSGANNGRIAAYYDKDRANIHQVLLQGDPALKILLSESSLPVELMSIEAINEPGRVKLIWKTAVEKNNGRFEVERSYNARNFEKIGVVEGNGTVTTESNYFFYDINPLSGTSYYRLKQFDTNVNPDGTVVDGSFTNSIIVSVNRGQSNLLTASPNPTTDFVELSLDAPVQIKKWDLYDVKGRLRKQNQLGVRVYLSDLESGEYIVKITTDNGDVFNKKVVKK
ncbi:putative type IX secretion system sortase PorU2 [Dyadobacter bucti]|uniref:putative type IX secretion system sortase PorU2 n=1 Tax=Dyadobacter bucti TaxID=2572203 RepID=UPI001109A220|nr:C25 family cysteine peptidase [Dyadobacter bucti]